MTVIDPRAAGQRKEEPMSAPELTAEEQATVDRFGILAEEERVERVARALADECATGSRTTGRG